MNTNFLKKFGFKVFKIDRIYINSLQIIIVLYSLIFLFTCIYIYQTCYSELQKKASETSENIEKILSEEIDFILLECSNFIKEITFKKKPLYFDNVRRLSIYIPSQFIFNNNIYLSHKFEFNIPYVDKDTGLWTLSLKTELLNVDNKKIGFIEKKLNQREFSERIINKLAMNGIFYALIDKNYNFILKSANNIYNSESFKYIKYIEDKDIFSFEKKQKFSLHNEDFIYFSPLKNYPFNIICGIDNKYFFYSLFKQIGFVTILFLLMLTATLCVIKYINIKKDKFLFSFNQRAKNYYFNLSLETTLDHIKGFSYLSLQDNFSNDFKKKKIQIVYLKNLVEDCLLLLSDAIDKYKIKINTSIDSNLYIQAESFLLQKILISLIDFSMTHNKEKTIYLSAHQINNETFINIEDSSFFISEPMREEFSNKINSRHYFISGFNHLKEISSAKGIKISIKERSPKGNTVIIHIPSKLSVEKPVSDKKILPFKKN